MTTTNTSKRYYLSIKTAPEQGWQQPYGWEWDALGEAVRGARQADAKWMAVRLLDSVSGDLTKALDEGRSDAERWISETPESEWADAIKPGTLGADEGLINALGVTEAARSLGVERAYDDGALTEAAQAAFGAYSAAWRARVEEEIAARG